ncbi:MAG: NmrA/HSCARG family protein [Bacteroidetes bacterium]|nr:NmrA/HSCARG family protein [Bacteroidota bacterium]
MEKKIIAVIGASGSQGNGVIHSILKDGTFKARAVTRNPEKYSGKADEVVKGDLTDIASLTEAFKNAYGVFVVTNFWEGADEIEQGKTAIQAAKNAGVNHFIWSTLPNVEKISNGKFDVPHFTGKAMVDELVKNAGFKNYTFVQPPFYYQNFSGMLGAQPKQDGSTGWTLPIDPSKKVIHMSDINDLGKVVTGAFSNPEKVGQGSYLALATELNSFNDILATFKANGKEYSFTQVPGELFSTFFDGAKEISEMMAYFEAHTYMGPNSESNIQQANTISTESFTSFNEWIKNN